MITILDEIFAAYGIPITIVSDNGTQFTSAEFRTFLQTSGVKYHKLSALYHPATNGQAEHYVQTTNDSLYKMATTPGSLQRDLNEFLRQYWKAPHATTGHPLAQLFLGRNLHIRLDLVRTDTTPTKVTEKQQVKFDSTFRVFRPQQQVYFISGNLRMDKWVPGTIVTRQGDLHYEINHGGKSFKRHVDEIRAYQQKESVDQPADPVERSTRTVETPKLPQRVHFYENRTEASTASEK